VSYEDPDRPGVLRVLETSYLAEVIDPVSLEPLAAGRAGELVLTTLGRIGSPLLRYRTGDLVRVRRFDDGTPPFVGLEGGVIGRVDDMVIVRGVNVHPSAVEDIARRFTDLAEYRVMVRTRAALAELEVESEAAPTCADPAGLARAFELALRDALSLRIPVRAVAPGTLPRFEMKARRWVRQP
jgi:phenylacetate-CoA ligase